jgi:hypothetical protein
MGKTLAAVCLLLAGCATGGHWQNVNNSSYGTAEYDKDAAQCRKENSRVVERVGYDTTTEVVVDEAKAKACVAARGWRQS